MSEALRRGRRVHIRLLEPADEREVLRSARASRALHRPWSHPPTTPEAFRELIGRDDATNERIVVCRNKDGAFVGYFGLGQIFYGKFRNAYLGYYVAGCRSLEYKARFRPNEILDDEGQWVPFDG